MTSPLDGLTPRERAVAQDVLKGKRIDIVAHELGLSPRTVETHLRSVYRKLGVSSRAELAATFMPDLTTTSPRLDGMPVTRYARCGEVNIAYQVVGEGEPAIVVVPGIASHLEVLWEHPDWRRFVRRLSTLGTVVFFDKRGTGLSDPIPGERPQSMAERMDDVIAIMDSIGIDRAVMFGMSEGAPMSIHFTGAHPERVSALLLYGSTVPNSSNRAEQKRQFMALVDAAYGTGMVAGSLWPSMLATPEGRVWLGRFERYCVSRTQVQSIIRGNLEIDAEVPFPDISVPVTVVHVRDDPAIPFAGGEVLAQALPNARFVPIDGSDHVPWGDVDLDAVVDELRALTDLATTRS